MSNNFSLKVTLSYLHMVVIHADIDPQNVYVPLFSYKLYCHTKSTI